MSLYEMKLRFKRWQIIDHLFIFVFYKQVIVFHFWNECKRKFCAKIRKTVLREIIEVERRIKKIERTIEICKYFASTV